MGLLPVSVALAKEAYDNRYRADIPRGVRKLCSGGNLARRSGRLAKPSYGVSPSTSIFDPAVRSFSNFSRSLIFRSAERSKLLLTVVAILFLLAFPAARESRAQSPISPPGSGLTLRFGSELPADVATIYERGLVYLAGAQQADGSWQGMGNPGVTGICLMAFLASGDDPNFGRYHSNVRAAVRSLILTQDPDTGYFGNSMYHHGFAMLALAEVYGAFDESRLWDGSEDAKRKRTIIDAIDLAVRSAVTSQKKNQWGGWRYSPDSNDADTSVTGAVLMGLLAARNAGIEVSDESVETALGYFQKSTSEAGMVAYSGFGGMGESMNRSSIAALVYSIGKKRDWDEFDSTVKYISSHLEHQEQSHPNYFSYYMAQALFQGNFEAWEKWNRQIIRQLKDLQQSDGSFVGSQGPEYGTGMSLLAVALNYRFLPIYER